MTKYYKSVQVEIVLNPCTKCGSTNIELWDCNYSSFNPGGGKCLDCGREVKKYVSCIVTEEELAKVWNDGNNIDKDIEYINNLLLGNEDRVEYLLKEKARLESLSNK